MNVAQEIMLHIKLANQLKHFELKCISRFKIFDPQTAFG